MGYSQDDVPSIEDVGLSSTAITPKQSIDQLLGNDSVYFYQLYYKPLSLSLVSTMNIDSLVKDSIMDSFNNRYKSDSYDFTAINIGAKRNIDSEQFPEIVRSARKSWTIYLLFGIITFFVAIKYNYFKDFKNINDGFWTVRGVNLLIREDNLLNSRSSLLFFLLFSFTYGLVIYNICAFYDLVLSYKGFQLYLVFSLGTAIVFFVRTLLLLLLRF